MAFFSLRPFGGVACLPLAAGHGPDLNRLATEAHLANARVREAGEWTLLSREGALPGSADWTHEHADPARIAVQA